MACRDSSARMGQVKIYKAECLLLEIDAYVWHLEMWCKSSTYAYHVARVRVKVRRHQFFLFNSFFFGLKQIHVSERKPFFFTPTKNASMVDTPYPASHT